MTKEHFAPAIDEVREQYGTKIEDLGLEHVIAEALDGNDDVISEPPAEGDPECNNFGVWLGYEKASADGEPQSDKVASFDSISDTRDWGNELADSLGVPYIEGESISIALINDTLDDDDTDE